MDSIEMISYKNIQIYKREEKAPDFLQIDINSFNKMNMTERENLIFIVDGAFQTFNKNIEENVTLKDKEGKVLRINKSKIKIITESEFTDLIKKINTISFKIIQKKDPEKQNEFNKENKIHENRNTIFGQQHKKKTKNYLSTQNLNDVILLNMKFQSKIKSIINKYTEEKDRKIEYFFNVKNEKIKESIEEKNKIQKDKVEIDK